MKRLFTILFALFVSFYSSAQCTDPSASNYNLNGYMDIEGYTLHDGTYLPGPCCYENTISVYSLQGVLVEVTGPIYLDFYQNFQSHCVEEGVYSVEVNFPENMASQVTIYVSDGQILNLNSDLGSPYFFELNIGGHIAGCMDPSACDYNPSATIQQVACDFSCQGCTDVVAVNYNPNVSFDNGTCLYYDYTIVASGPFTWSVLLDNWTQLEVEGVLIPGTTNYSALAPGNDSCSCVQFNALDPQTDYSILVYNEFMQVVNSIDSFEYSSSPICYNAEGVVPGCPDPNACNYNPFAVCGTFVYCNYDCYGCTDPLAENYEIQATIDNGTCCLGQLLTFDFVTSDPNNSVNIISSEDAWTSLWTNDYEFCFDGGCIQVYGYLDSPATLTAHRPDGSLLFQCSSTIDASGYHNLLYYFCENDIWGCRDQFACNYNPDANVDAECDYSCHGCTNPAAPNYNPAATIENNTCCYDSWFNVEFSEPCYWYIYNPFTGMYLEGNYPEDNGYCSDQVLDPSTWGMSVTNDDHAQISGSRFITDCYILQAISVSGNPVDFTITDGSGQVIASSTGNTDPILNADVSENTDDEPGCTDPIACNYNINASCNNGSCIYNCGGCTDVNALNFNSDASWEDGTCEYTLQAPTVTYTTSPAILPNHFMIEFNVQELGNSFEYILSSDYNTAQRIVDEYTTYEMGPYPCDVAIDFKMRSLDFNLVEAWSAEDVQVACTSLSVEETKTEQTFGFYPNPANDRIVLTGLRSEQYTLQIIDIAGRVALNETISGNAAGVEVTLNNLQSGAYIVRAFNDSGSQSARLILEGR
jgi:hypothetical protein